MEDRLVAREELPPDALRTLAAERAQRAREALVAAGLDPARIFLSAEGSAGKERAPRVYFSVR
jgi:LmbE family N-acetylglucosaminyl deacetylase